MRPGCRILSKALTVLLALTTAASQDFQIRTRVDLVVVPVTVRTSNGTLVSGLSKDDFAVFEDGRPQSISHFTTDPVPISAVVLLDTGLSEKSLARLQATLPALAGAFSDFDEIAVFRFDKFVTQLADFSSDTDLLLGAMNKLKDAEAANPPVAAGPFANSGPVINGQPVAPSIQAGVRLPSPGGKSLHDAVFTAADALSKRAADRRRMVLVVSDGRTAGSGHSYDEVLQRLLDHNIEVYAIGMDVAFLARRLSVLHDYSRETGGDAVFVSSTEALENAYTRAAEKARNRYILGYLSANRVAGRAPVFRRIQVKADRPGVEVLHRKGYYQYP